MNDFTGQLSPDDLIYVNSLNIDFNADTEIRLQAIRVQAKQALFVETLAGLSPSQQSTAMDAGIKAVVGSVTAQSAQQQPA